MTRISVKDMGLNLALLFDKMAIPFIPQRLLVEVDLVQRIGHEAMIPPPREGEELR